MLSNRLIAWAVVVVCVLGVYGCSKKTNQPGTTPPTGQTTTTTEKTQEQYQAEANKQINAQNASSELNKLEQEVGAEANQP